MPIEGYDNTKCKSRNRIAALRYDADSAPFFFLEGPISHQLAQGSTLKKIGNLPDTPAAALRAINALQPDGAKKLTAEDVYIHYGEAANDNKIPSRFMSLGESTLRNISKDAQKGFAFMNSHRSGGLSHPGELPFGRTFGGQFIAGVDANGDLSMSAMIGFYMLKGVYPGGDNGPSTDDMHSMIESGTVFDLSVGIGGGSQSCDICGNDLSARDKSGNYICEHVPGTTVNMSDNEVKTQKQRGWPKGVASYTYHGASCSEVSAVYDGAVPGAGIRKVFSMMKPGASLSIDDNVRAELSESYGNMFMDDKEEELLDQKRLSGDNTSNLPKKVKGKKMSWKDTLAKLGISQADLRAAVNEDDDDDQPQLNSAERDELTVLRNAQASMQANLSNILAPSAKLAADVWARDLLKNGVIVPTQESAFSALHQKLSLLEALGTVPSDMLSATIPVVGKDGEKNQTFTLSALLGHAFSDAKSNGLSEEQVAAVAKGDKLDNKLDTTLTQRNGSNNGGLLGGSVRVIPEDELSALVGQATNRRPAAQ